MVDGMDITRKTADEGKQVVTRVEMERRLAEEKELFRGLSESLGDWVWEMDLNGIHTYSNDAAMSSLGYSSEEIIGTDSMLLWPERCLTDEQRANHLKILAKGTGWRNFQTIFRHKNGRSVYFLSSAVPLFDEDGKLTGYRGIDRDITEKVAKDRELKESKEKLESIIETTVEVVYTQDLSGCITFISPSVKNLLGYAPEEIVGKNPRDLIHPDHLEKYDDSLTMLLAEKRPVIGEEKRISHRERGWVWAKVNKSVIKGADGKVQAIVGGMEDITRRKQNEEGVLQFNELLTLINKILRHDLTNNLTVMDIALKLYKKNGDEGLLDSVRTKVDGSYRLIDQMKSLESLISEGGSLRSIDVHEVIDRVSVSMEVPVGNQCFCEVVADDAFHSVLENLILNSIKHGGTDRMLIRSMDYPHEEGVVSIDVIDYGKGVPDDIKEKVFRESFTHGEAAGTGLGLYIVKRTLQRYGGSITVHDNEPKGAVFRLMLRKAAS